MPPRIRTRASKALKENIDVTANKLKPVKNTTKAQRKALADITNSASDDPSLEIPTKTIPKKTITKTSKTGSNRNGEQKQSVKTKQSKQKQTVKSIENTVPAQSKENTEPVNDVRPHRDRRLPNRFVENIVLNNLSNSKDSPNVALNSSATDPEPDRTPTRKDSLSNSNKPELSPFKTPAKADSSLLANRPRRICRLPSRFEDHSVSPNKYIPIQPANASTPIQQSKTKPVVPLHDRENANKDVRSNQEKLLTVVPVNTEQNVNQKGGKDHGKTQPVVPQYDKENVNKNVGKEQEKKPITARPTRLAKINALQKKTNDNSSDKSSPDSNNNAKASMRRKKTQPSAVPANKKSSPVKKAQSPIRKFLTPMSRFSSLSNKTQSPIKKISPKKPTNNKKSDKNLSFKLLGSKKTSQKSDNNEHRDDIYEFTFDPDEEPKPQKKKRKRNVTKKSTVAPVAKPKKVIYKSTYDQNISKALAALKNAVKPGKSTEAAKLTQITEISDDEEQNFAHNNVANNVNAVQTTNVTKENNMAFNDTGKNSVHECNYPSIRVEDIAADIEASVDHHDDINYSPVNSPRPNVLNTPNAHESVNQRKSSEKSVHNDPLNLLEELSFFDEQPVASSSMNMSVRNPLASPWRVEFGSLPIKWPNNAHVKANMTPAVETSFINPEDSINKKKHVYTNMLPQTNEMFADVADTPNLKQTSIISFIKEMAEKSAKKKRGRSVSPTKAIYQDVVDISGEANKNKKMAKKVTEDKTVPPSNNTSEEVSSSANDVSTDKENSKEERRSRKRKNDENLCHLPAKSPRKQKDKDVTFFGFDESENQDENVSPIKEKNNPVRGRSLRPRSKAVLQEINGPTRAVLPVAAKTKIATSSEAVNKVYEELKSAADAPVFPEKNVEDNATNIEELEVNDDAQSVHLFEDIEVLYHVKPTRKSYGKAKKVTFRQYSSSDSDTQVPVAVERNDSSDYDDLGDLTFEVPDVKEKKITKKKKSKKLRTKKEEKEAEVWAANFNSMCEDIEEFPLLVE